MVTASFKEGQKAVITTSLQKYDYGEVLRIKGLSLPRYVAVQFAVDGMSEALPSSIGETVEDVTDVLIPNSLLRSNIKPWNYNIMAYVYIVSGSSGKTEYTITIPVKWRPKTGDDQAADDDVASVIGSAVEKMNTATTKAENAANQAAATAEEIKADRAQIQTNAGNISGLKEDLTCLTKLDLGEFIKDTYIVYSNGSATKFEPSTVSYNATDYIDVSFAKGLIVTIAYLDKAGIAFYDYRKKYITGYGIGDLQVGDSVFYLLPDGAKYVRYSVVTSSNYNAGGLIQYKPITINNLEYKLRSAIKAMDLINNEHYVNQYSWPAFGNDYNNLEMNTVYAITYFEEGVILHAPYQRFNGLVICVEGTAYVPNDRTSYQIAISASASRILIRNKWGQKEWTSWIEIPNRDLYNSISETVKKCVSRIENLEREGKEMSIDFIDDYYISYLHGNTVKYPETSGAKYYASDFVDCTYITQITMKQYYSDQAGYAFYDKNKNFISGNGYDTTNHEDFITISVPTNATYFRVSKRKQYDDTYGKFAVYATMNFYEIKQKIREMGKGNSTDGVLKEEFDPNGMISVFDTVGCIGDSLASGEVYYKKSDGTYAGIDMYDISWGQCLAKMTGNTYYNFSRGGLRADTWLTDSKGKALAFDGHHLCKAYIIGLAQNDANKISRESLDPATYCGTLKDINLTDYNQNADTFYGNYGKIIQLIKEAQPKAKIFVITDVLEYVENYGLNAVIRDMPNLFTNVYLMDLYKYRDKYVSDSWMVAQKRSGHYNAVAYRKMASYIGGFINQIMVDNPSEFREIEFIGTNYSFYD